MPVWFVYRSFDTGPTGKLVRRFDDDTVLGWFRRNWSYLAVADRDEADDRLWEVLGIGGWPLVVPFIDSGEAGLPPPETVEDVVTRFNGSFGDDQARSDSPHAVQVFTEDDGEGGAVYWFDGHFLAESGPLAAYLLDEDWRLPSGAGEGGFEAGATYLLFMVRESKYPLEDLVPADRIDGVRLPGLAQRLLAEPPEDGYARLLPALMVAGVTLPDPMEQAFLTAIRADPADATTWAAWSDWREERGGEPPGISLLRSAFARLARLPGEAQDGLPLDQKLKAASRQLLETERRAKRRADPKSLIHVEEHLAQMCLDTSHSEEPYFGQWILFDDVWASAHPDLANALLRYAGRWDVLSSE
ncbi:MAG: hypothetical protein ACRC33_19560 [Gemmataceae bacterium]